MKKFVVALLTCFALVQSTYAATSALTESLLEFEAITSAIGTDPAFENVIPATEFIVEIERLTKKINVLGTVKYEILTRSETTSHKKKCRINKYIATLTVTQNPGIGPNIVTVDSIVKVRKHKD